MTIEAKQQRLIERYNDILDKAEERIIQRINRSLAASFQNLSEELLKKYPQVQANTNLFPSQRKLLLLAEMKNLLDITQGGNYNQAFEELLKVSNREGVNLASQLMNAVESDFVRAAASIPIEAVKVVAEEQTKYLSRWGQDFADKASATVEQGLIQGWGVPQLQTALMSNLGVTKMRAEAIARTASVSAGNGAMLRQFKKNGVEGFIWIATGDDRLCPICAWKNGQAYRLEDARPPGHVRCRCFMTPFKEKWLKKNLINKEWYANHRAKGLEELREAGREPNKGLSSFEKSVGLTEPPQPIWTPTEGMRRNLAPAKMVKQDDYEALVIPNPV